MADRYWVGGTGTWDASTTTNWATTSGGAGGASAPTSADNAYFDGNSDSGAPFTVSVNAGAVCADLIVGDGSTVTVLDQTMTFRGLGNFSVFGNLFFPATSFTTTAPVSQYIITFSGTGSYTLTTNGHTIFGSMVFTSSRTTTLGSALSQSQQWADNFTINSGTFDTAVYNISGSKIRINGGTFNANSSTIGTLVNEFTVLAAATFNAGSSVISLQGFSGSSIIFNGGGKTYNTVLSSGSNAGPSIIINGSNTISKLVFDPSVIANKSIVISSNQTIDILDIRKLTSTSIATLSLGANLTITGSMNVQSGYGATFDITDTAGAITAATVNAGGEGYNVGDVLNVTGGNGDAQLTVATLSGTAIATVTISTPGTGYTTATGVATTLATSALNPNRRVLIASNSIGTARTITAAAVNITNTDFRNITGAGAATWSDSGRTRYWGNCLGNSGITFSAGVSKYRIGTGNWSATQWAASSGGSPAAGDFPLAQDTCVFDANTTTGTHTLDASYNIGSLDMSALTVAVTLATGSTSPTFYGNVTLDADVTLSGTGTFTFAGQGTTQTITSAGRTFTQQLTANVLSGTVTLADTFTSINRVTLTSGTFSINNQQATLSNFVSANETTTRVLDFGASGALNLTALGDTWNVQNLTNFSFAGTQQVNFVAPGAYTVGNTVLHGNLAGGNEARSLSVNIQSGSGTFRLAGSSHINSINTTGFAGVLEFVNTLVYGDLLIVPSVSSLLQSGYIRFLKSSGTQTLTTSGKTIQGILQKYNGGILQLLDDVTTVAAAQFELNTGTLDLNDKTLSTGTFSSSNSNTRSIDFGAGGRIELIGSGTVFNATTGTNLTTTGTGVIDLTSASTKTFAGGGRTYPTLNQGGSGTLLITGANTFADITNTVQPTTITFPSGVTTSVQDFNVNGTPGNLVTLNASTPGSRAFLNKI